MNSGPEERYFLKGAAVGISVSDSPDLDVLGLSELHLQDAATEIARHILVAGGQLVYGGDLRARGFTHLLLELVARHWRASGEATSSASSQRPDSSDGPRPPVAFTNYLPWPGHLYMDKKAIAAQTDGFADAASLVLLDRDGREILRRGRFRRHVVSAVDWDEGLTSMRRLATGRVAARLALGGQVEDFKGKMPGVAEEVSLAIEAGLPTYLLGGFGGCARDIAEFLGLAGPSPARPAPSSRTWPGSDRFDSLSGRDLRNGLSPLENARLAETPHVDEAITLVLRGLRRVSRGEPG